MNPPSPLSSCLRRMSRARLNSSYISPVLKVEVSGSCIIVFLDIIVRIAFQLESGSAVEDDVLLFREAEKSLPLTSGKELRPDFLLLVRRRVRNNESLGLQICQAIQRSRDNLALTIRYICFAPRLIESTYGHSTDMGVVRIRA